MCAATRSRSGNPVRVVVDDHGQNKVGTDRRGWRHIPVRLTNGEEHGNYGPVHSVLLLLGPKIFHKLLHEVRQFVHSEVDDIHLQVQSWNFSRRSRATPLGYAVSASTSA